MTTSRTAKATSPQRRRATTDVYSSPAKPPVLSPTLVLLSDAHPASAMTSTRAMTRRMRRKAKARKTASAQPGCPLLSGWYAGV